MCHQIKLEIKNLNRIFSVICKYSRQIFIEVKRNEISIYSHDNCGVSLLKFTLLADTSKFDFGKKDSFFYTMIAFYIRNYLILHKYEKTLVIDFFYNFVSLTTKTNNIKNRYLLKYCTSKDTNEFFIYEPIDSFRRFLKFTNDQILRNSYICLANDLYLSLKKLHSLDSIFPVIDYNLADKNKIAIISSRNTYIAKINCIKSVLKEDQQKKVPFQNRYLDYIAYLLKDNNTEIEIKFKPEYPTIYKFYYKNINCEMIIAPRDDN